MNTAPLTYDTAAADSKHGDIISVTSLQGHISSVRCLTCVPKHMCQRSSHLVFSAGGRAQLCCWRVPQLAGKDYDIQVYKQFIFKLNN